MGLPPSDFASFENRSLQITSSSCSSTFFIPPRSLNLGPFTSLLASLHLASFESESESLSESKSESESESGLEGEAGSEGEGEVETETEIETEAEAEARAEAESE